MTPASKLADMEPVLAQVASWDNSQARDPLYEFSNFLQAAIASKAELPQVEARLLRMLAPRANTTPAARDYVCRQLSLIGTGASVAALARLLSGRATAEMARYTLARIPDPAAAAALRDALPKTSGAVQAGIVNALGERRDAKAVPALKGLIGSSDAAVSDAALSALARIGDAPSLAAIQAALPNAGIRREAVLGACIRCAGAVSAGGNTATAASVYRRLSAASQPDMIRIAAFDGLVLVDATAAIPALSKELDSANAVIAQMFFDRTNRSCRMRLNTDSICGKKARKVRGRNKN